MKRYVAEFAGTFALIFAGCGAMVVNDLTGSLGHIGVCMAWGLMVMAIIYSIGDVSGAHINPAVTIAFWIGERFSGRKVPGYLIAQILGACAAAGFLKLLFPEHETLGATLSIVSLWKTFIFEFVFTLLLMFIVLHVSTCCKEEGMMAGIAVGGTVTLISLFGGPLTGSSMNPARSIGPALLSGELRSIWLYIAAPILGALAAVPLYHATREVTHICETQQ